MMSHRILSAALLLCTLAACGDVPTHTDPQAQPAGPAYDGGFTMGSGNSAAGGYTIGSENIAEADGGGFGIGSGNIESDGGYGMGSGNLTAAESGYGIGSDNVVAEAGEGVIGLGDAELSNTTESDTTGRGGYGMGSGN